MTNAFSSPRRARRILTAAVIVTSALVLGACGSLGNGNAGSDSSTGSPDGTQPLTSDPGPDDSGISDSGTTVSGYVRMQDGQPVAGESVEFESPLGFNFHTTTDTDGYYSLTLIAGAYNAEAPDISAETNVVGRPDNTVSVPPSTTVNFVAVPVS
jgi:hypothetical protein